MRMHPVYLILLLCGFAAGIAMRPAFESPTHAQETAATPDNAELARLHAEDQADRRGTHKPEDGLAIVERDKARQARVKEMVVADLAKTAADYYHAAMVLQHGFDADDYLLAHELAVVAALKGHERGKWLAAAAEDRFLMKIARPQRFATQYRREAPGEPMRLYRVDQTVTDGLRREFKVPTLAEAKAREAKLGVPKVR